MIEDYYSYYSEPVSICMNNESDYLKLMVSLMF